MLAQRKSRLVTLGLIFLLFLASLAVSLAQENVVDRSDYTVKARLGMSSKVSGTERHGLQGRNVRRFNPLDQGLDRALAARRGSRDARRLFSLLISLCSENFASHACISAADLNCPADTFDFNFTVSHASYLVAGADVARRT